MRQTEILQSTSSLDRAARALRETSLPLIPVVDQNSFGVLTETDLALALSNGASPNDPVGPIAIVRPLEVINQFESAASALRRFSESGVPALVVLDPDRRIIGIVTPSDLYPKPPESVRMPMVGGMATPFGVYLTTGSLRAGAGSMALVSTGALMATFLVVGMLIADFLASKAFVAGWSTHWVDAISTHFPTVFFLASLRLSPIAGIHAAEHMTVHAIEREEPLVVSVVRRMPRVHPRCGTNFAVMAAVFISIFSARWLGDEEIRMLLAVLGALILRNPLGSLAQLLVTTKRPSDRQVEMGIRSGQELMEKIRANPMSRATIPQRIFNSGMLHVIAGSSAIVFLAMLLGLDK